MADDWDLQAVVRGCKATAITTSAVTGAETCCGRDEFIFSSSPIEPRLSPKFDDLSDFFKPPFPKSPISVFGESQDQSSPLPPQPAAAPDNGVKQSPSLSASPRSKRRKNQMKRVCQVPAEGLSSDKWSWRKYGQKPIKGSPFPRGYYRCSTLKGCLARRQVERNRSDPEMFIVTYTGDHNHPRPAHRNSLAGLTRQNKPPVSDDIVAAADPCKPSSPDSSTSLSPAMEKVDAYEDDEFGVSDMAIGDDFFDGLEDLAGAGDLFSGHSPANLPFASPATTAGGG